MRRDMQGELYRNDNFLTPDSGLTKFNLMVPTAQGSRSRLLNIYISTNIIAILQSLSMDEAITYATGLHNEYSGCIDSQSAPNNDETKSIRERFNLLYSFSNLFLIYFFDINSMKSLKMPD